MSKDDHWLNDSVVSRIARGPGFESRSGHDFSSPVTFGGQCGFAARATSIKKCMSRCSSVVPSGFGDESN